jgi:hypothetical protein
VGHAAPGVVVHALLDVAGFGVHDQAHAAQVVADDVVGLAIAQQGAGYVGFVGVDEDATNAAGLGQCKSCLDDCWRMY